MDDNNHIRKLNALFAGKLLGLCKNLSTPLEKQVYAIGGALLELATQDPEFIRHNRRDFFYKVLKELNYNDSLLKEVDLSEKYSIPFLLKK